MVASGPEIVAVDPATTTIRTQMPLNAQDAGSVVVASGSLWVMVTTGPGTCAVDRIDPASLKVTGQATPPRRAHLWSHRTWRELAISSGPWAKVSSASTPRARQWCRAR